MKKRLSALVLCCLMLCSGCASMLERGYTSSSAHVDYSATDDSSVLRAESYQALVNSILYFVGEHVGGGIIRLYNYTGNAEADLARACAEVMEDDPLGAYAVRSIDYESTRILTYYEVKFRILYQRTAAEVAEIRTVSGQSGVRHELDRMISGRLSQVTLRTAYFTSDAELVGQLFWLSFYSTPTMTLAVPEFTAAFYPETGTQRILELKITWPLAAESLAEYSSALSASADALFAAAPSAGDRYTVQELAGLVRGSVAYDPSGSHSALSALNGEPVNDLGVLLALEFLCQQQGIEVSVVSDSAGAQMWLIVATPSGYRHLLPRDLRPAVQTETGGDPDGEAWTLPLYTDEELAALGFEWPRDLHPACVDYSGAISE